MQQIFAKLKAEPLVDANNMVAELRKLNPTIAYKCVHNPLESVLCFLSDAAHPSDIDYGQTEFLTGIPSKSGIGKNDILHITDWSSQKPNQTSHSKYVAETTAAETADDREILYEKGNQHIVFEDAIETRAQRRF